MQSGISLLPGVNASRELSLVVDLGTNGEVILGDADWLASVSCASGPAFEGAGISSGMRAMKGAIDHVTIDPVSGEVSWTTIGNARPRGICGSGIIDAAAAMVAAGILDFTGRLVEGRPGVRRSAAGLEFVLVPREKTATGQDIVITRDDMAYLMDSKAATCGSIGVLLKKYRVGVEDVRHVYLAGAFGAYTDTEKIVAFGIIPDFHNAEFHQIGNGSLSGACAALLSLAKRRDTSERCEKDGVYRPAGGRGFHRRVCRRDLHPRQTGVFPAALIHSRNGFCKTLIFIMMIAPLAPALPPLGAGAPMMLRHYLQKDSAFLCTGNTSPSHCGGCHSSGGGGRVAVAPRSVSL